MLQESKQRNMGTIHRDEPDPWTAQLGALPVKCSEFCRTSGSLLLGAAFKLTLFRVIDYSPLKVNALQLVGDLGGGSGTFFTLLLQRKFRFSIKSGAFYGACLTLPP